MAASSLSHLYFLVPQVWQSCRGIQNFSENEPSKSVGIRCVASDKQFEAPHMAPYLFYPRQVVRKPVGNAVETLNFKTRVVHGDMASIPN